MNLARPWLVAIGDKSIRVHAPDAEAARAKALQLVSASLSAQLDAGVQKATRCDHGPCGVLLPDRDVMPDIWKDLGEPFGWWATDGYCAFHESLAWTVQRSGGASQWYGAGKGTAAEIRALLERPRLPIVFVNDGLRVPGIGNVVEGPGNLALNVELWRPFEDCDWLGGEDRSALAVRDGRPVALVMPIYRDAVQHAKDDRRRMARRMAQQTTIADPRPTNPPIRITPDSMDTLPSGPEDFGGTDEGSHFMAPTSAAKLRETE